MATDLANAPCPTLTGSLSPKYLFMFQAGTSLYLSILFFENLIFEYFSHDYHDYYMMFGDVPCSWFYQ